jgi:hypothetical protein
VFAACAAPCIVPEKPETAHETTKDAMNNALALLDSCMTYKFLLTMESKSPLAQSVNDEISNKSPVLEPAPFKRRQKRTNVL